MLKLCLVLVKNKKGETIIIFFRINYFIEILFDINYIFKYNHFLTYKTFFYMKINNHVKELFKEPEIKTALTKLVLQEAKKDEVYALAVRKLAGPSKMEEPKRKTLKERILGTFLGRLILNPFGYLEISVD